MAHQIQVALKYGVKDSFGQKVRAHIVRDLGIEAEDVETIKVYTINSKNEKVENNLEKIAQDLFPDPILNKSSHTDQLAAEKEFSWIIEIGSKPGVVDNPGKTSKKAIEDMLDVKLSDKEQVYTSAQYVIKGELTREQVERIAAYLHNPLIMTAHIKSRDEFLKDSGMNVPNPEVELPPETYVDDVVEMQVLDEKGDVVPSEVADEEGEKSLNNKIDWKKIEVMGSKGILDTRKKMYRGPLALSIASARAIRDYFAEKGRNPTDVELESIAQTWSEHCKHTIFANLGLFDQLKEATRITRERKGLEDRCVSVFSDNSGVIRFAKGWNICYKIETHNSPSALDPYGGAITGIVGVNRDPMGTGIGARLLINIYGFCFGYPNSSGIYKEENLFRDQKRTLPLLHPKVIFEGVRLGVEHGGNKSGIPTSWGFLNFHPDYSGKPLVFVGTVGLMPHELNVPGEEMPRKTAEKSADAGYLIVMAGNRVGVDGVHGATFSSEIMGEGSPATAVQIGDPITQKRLHDAQLEARGIGLYTAVTDNGAGGLSCSVPELCDDLKLGCEVWLQEVPLKYQGINPNEIWISESQERMTYLVHPDKIKEFLDLMKRRDVEATVIGVATEERKCIVKHNNFKGIDGSGTIMDVDMDFLHRGLPKEKLETKYTPKLYQHDEPETREERLEDMTEAFYSMLGRLNICSKEYVVRQFDHEVQGGSAVKPLVGRNQDVHSDASVTRPLLLYQPNGDPIVDSMNGIVLSHALFPRLSFIDTEKMARAAVDTAIRNAVAVGADPDDIYLLDNFCWCSSNEPERLGQLERAVKGAVEMSIAAGAPFISGKDSMFNDFRGYPEEIGKPDEPMKISVPPTLLISSIGVVEDVNKCVTMDAKFAGDLVYVLGETKDELGGSEYYAMIGEQKNGEEYIGNKAPSVDIEKNMELYRAVHNAIKKGLIVSCKSVKAGGLAVALAETAMGGELGLDVDLSKVVRSSELNSQPHDDKVLFSESMGRLVVTINPAYKEQFEKMIEGQQYACIGKVTDGKNIVMQGLEGDVIVDARIGISKESYKRTLDWGYHQEAA